MAFQLPRSTVQALQRPWPEPYTGGAGEFGPSQFEFDDPTQLGEGDFGPVAPMGPYAPPRRPRAIPGVFEMGSLDNYGDRPTIGEAMKSIETGPNLGNFLSRQLGQEGVPGFRREDNNGELKRSGDIIRENLGAIPYAGPIAERAFEFASPLNVITGGTLGLNAKMAGLAAIGGPTARGVAKELGFGEGVQNAFDLGGSIALPVFGPAAGRAIGAGARAVNSLDDAATLRRTAGAGERSTYGVMGREALPDDPGVFAPATYRARLGGAADDAAGDYRGQHGAPLRDSGAPLHDITGGGDYYPADVYGPNAKQYYGTGDPLDDQALGIIQSLKGRPNGMVTIYRAVPKAPKVTTIASLEDEARQIMRRGSRDPGRYDAIMREIEALRVTGDPPAAPRAAITPGDWVTPVRDYAVEHGQSALNGQYRILSKRVKASDIFTNGDSWLEYGYDPPIKPVKAPRLGPGSLRGGADVADDAASAFPKLTPNKLPEPSSPYYRALRDLDDELARETNSYNPQPVAPRPEALAEIEQELGSPENVRAAYAWVRNGRAASLEEAIGLGDAGAVARARELLSAVDQRLAGVATSPIQRAASAAQRPTVRAYHSTNSDAFESFDPSKVGSATDSGLLGEGHYLTTDPKPAYGKARTLPFDVTLDNPLTVKYPAWEANKQQLVSDALGADHLLTSKEITALARSRGYDGVVLDYSPVGYPHKEIVSFDSAKAVSAAQRSDIPPPRPGFTRLYRAEPKEFRMRTPDEEASWRKALGEDIYASSTAEKGRLFSTTPFEEYGHGAPDFNSFYVDVPNDVAAAAKRPMRGFRESNPPDEYLLAPEIVATKQPLYGVAPDVPAPRPPRGSASSIPPTTAPRSEVALNPAEEVAALKAKIAVEGLTPENAAAQQSLLERLSAVFKNDTPSWEQPPAPVRPGSDGARIGDVIVAARRGEMVDDALARARGIDPTAPPTRPTPQIPGTEELRASTNAEQSFIDSFMSPEEAARRARVAEEGRGTTLQARIIPGLSNSSSTGAVLGGATGYGTTDEDATPLERIGRTTAGAVLGAVAGKAVAASWKSTSLAPGVAREATEAAAKRVTAAEKAYGAANEAMKNRTPGAWESVKKAMRALDDAKAGATLAAQSPPAVADPVLKHALRVVADIGNIPRSLMSSIDISGSLRQAGYMGPRHIREWKSAMGAQFRAIGSEDAAKAIQNELDNGPLSQFRKEADLYQTDWMGADLTKREEAFMSKMAEGIPGVKQTSRGYAVLLNKYRADLFDSFVSNLDDIQRTPQRLKEYARYVEAATGRGSLPAFLEDFAPVLNAGLFSPRFLFSIPQRHLAAFTRDPIIRKEVIKDMGAFYGTGLTIMGSLIAAERAGILPGVSIETDPRSSDWGKIKIGDKTRLDIWGGNQQFARMMAQTIVAGAGQQNVKDVNTGRMSDKAIGEVVSDFLRNKFSPVANLEEQLRTGRNNFGGKAPSADETAIRLVTPLLIQELHDAYNVGSGGSLFSGDVGDVGEGLKTAAWTLPSAVGIGTSTFAPRAGSGGSRARPSRPTRPQRPTRPTR